MAITKTSKNNSEKDLQLKLKLERPLSRQLLSFLNEILQELQQLYIGSNRVVRTLDHYSQLYAILLFHKTKAAKKFSNRIPKSGNKLSKNEEQSLIERIRKQQRESSGVAAIEILSTLQRDIDKAFTKAVSDKEAAQKTITKRKFAAIVKMHTKKSAHSRLRNTIPATEVQDSSEKSKLLAMNVYNSVSNEKSKKNNKTWHTVGDEEVRETHQHANGQEREINTPFSVGGSEMMQPGDSSMGAPLSETINCRCSLQYS